MKRRLLIILGLLVFQCNVQSVHAQSGTNVPNALYLKNGWILRGLISKTSGDSISIVTADKNRFVFSTTEVDHMTYHSYRHFGHFTEIGALAATQNRPDNVTTAAFSFQTVNGYWFGPRLFTGLGVAADIYATQTTIPVFASIRGDLLKKGLFVPYYFMDGGYGFDITSSTTSISYKSGPMFAAGIGFKIRFSNVAGFHVNFGYRMQKGATVESGVQTNYTNNRIALRAGFYL